MTLGSLSQWLALEHNISLVLGPGLESKSLVGEFQNVSVDTVLQHVAKRVGAEIRQTDGVYYIGTLDKLDRGFWVGRLPRVTAEEARTMVATFLSPDGQSTALADGLVVVVDKEPILQRIEALAKELGETRSTAWVLQFHVLSLSDETSRQLEAGGVPVGELSAQLLSGDASVTGSLVLDLILSGGASAGGVRRVAEPLLIVGDGEKVTFDRVEKIPYRSTLNESGGNVSSRTEAIDFLEVGFKLDASVKGLSESQAVLTCKVATDVITADGGGLPPRVAGEDFATVATLEPGGTYLLGGFDALSDADGWRLGRIGAITANKEKRSYQIWVRAYQIGSPTR